ncbi:PREDICTED: uncharacterized protein LOC108765369 [Trachymyrmex cornetzi]|uniref:uncharacterized protein LOC108765369 n=1 Tax=Trachymyrmex cornetzi TaxID=471704 RepID=UPI00084F7151|nr:PREDICTED: uncharacterized protein LOC108765369 [Trachymyrmex cornetzi]
MSQPSKPLFEEDNQMIRRILQNEGLSPEVELRRPKHQLFSVITNCLKLQQERNMVILKDLFTILTEQQRESTRTSAASASTKCIDHVVTNKHEDKHEDNC